MGRKNLPDLTKTMLPELLRTTPRAHKRAEGSYGAAYRVGDATAVKLANDAETPEKDDAAPLPPSTEMLAVMALDGTTQMLTPSWRRV